MPKKAARTITPEARIKRLCNKHALRNVTLSISEGVAAHAYPASWNPILETRRREAFAGKESVSLAEATEVATNAMTKAVASGHGSDINAALTSLEEALAKVAA